jgi:DNA-binding NarL/FixJ family response regulator
VEVVVDKVQVALYASTPLSLLGLAGYLRPQPAITVLAESERASADVAVLCCGRLTPGFVATMRRAAADTRHSLVLIVTELTEAQLLLALDCRVVEILPRAAVTSERLIRSVAAAARSNAVLPPGVVGELLMHIDRVQQETLGAQGTGAGFSAREIDVLRLMAEGLDTDEVAAELCYSHSTVKSVLSGITSRLKLRNRTHAVAYALRAKVI